MVPKFRGWSSAWEGVGTKGTLVVFFGPWGDRHK